MRGISETIRTMPLGVLEGKTGLYYAMLISHFDFIHISDGDCSLWC